MNPGFSDYKSSALTSRPRSPPTYQLLSTRWISKEYVLKFVFIARVLAWVLYLMYILSGNAIKMVYAFLKMHCRLIVHSRSLESNKKARIDIGYHIDDLLLVHDNKIMDSKSMSHL